MISCGKIGYSDLFSLFLWLDSNPSACNLNSTNISNSSSVSKWEFDSNNLTIFLLLGTIVLKAFSFHIYGFSLNKSDLFLSVGPYNLYTALFSAKIFLISVFSSLLLYLGLSSSLSLIALNLYNKYYYYYHLWHYYLLSHY